MIAIPFLRRVFWAAVTAGAFAFALFILIDTLSAIVPVWSPLPWFDEWATVRLIRAWQTGATTAAEVLFSQHNEHRILVPRLVFFADDLLFRGGGRLSLAAIFTVQALHAGLFAAVLGRSAPPRAGRWAVAAVVLALMFSLRQSENFTSGFQLQFVAVFAGATLSFVLFGLAAARERQGRPARGALLASLGAATVTTFTMANGLVVAYVLTVLALAARLRPRTVLACAASAAVLTVVYIRGYESVAHHGHPSDCLRHPLRLLVYVATYLGSIAVTGPAGLPTGLGLAGIAATVWLAVRSLRRGEAEPGRLAMLGVMLFVGATATVTAVGRIEFGVAQALSSRYVTGSVAFWAAQLTCWWIDPPGHPLRIGRRVVPSAALGRVAAAAVAAVLVVAVARGQHDDRPRLAAQGFDRNEAANALMLGLSDPAAMARTSWMEDDLPKMAETLKDDGLSIFGTADYAGLGRPLAERGTPSRPCDGAVSSAVADPTLGPGGVRVSGRAVEEPGRRRVRRVLVADAAGLVAGFASGAIPGAPRDAWRGYAVAPVGAALTAYGLVEGTRLCLIGTVTVMPPVQASQPAAAP